MMARGRDGGTGSEHLSDDLLHSLARQELSVAAAAGPLRHLAGCAGCRRRLADISPRAAELVDELWGSPESAGWIADPSKPEVLAAAAQSLPLFDQLQAERLERLPLLFNLRRLQSPFIALRLLQEARAAWQDDPIRASHLTQAAVFLVDRLTPGTWSAAEIADLATRAWGYRANTHRIEGHLSAAADALAEARRRRAAGTGDPLLRAELHEFTAVLCREQWRFEEAVSSFDEADEIYRRAHLPLDAARVAVSRASLHEERGERTAAIELLERTLPVLGALPGPEPLRLSALQILAVSHVRSGRPAEARRLLPAISDCLQRLGQGHGMNLLRVAWLVALIYEAEGRESAEPVFRQVQEIFLEMRIPFDAALLSLERAALLLRRGETAAAAELAGEVQPIFEQLEVEREALMSLRLLLEALREEAATVEAVQQAAQTLRRAPVA